MKKILTILLLLASPIVLWACPVCERRQPKLLRGIIHGGGPSDYWDYVIVTLMVIISLATLFYSVKMLIRPQEKEIDHIKYSIFKTDDHE